MDEAAIIVAAGKGVRMNNKTPKQFLFLNGQPIVWYSIRAFSRYNPHLHLVLVLHPDWIPYWQKLYEKLPEPLPVKIVAGGSTRAESVKNGLSDIKNTGFVAVHDAVRPLITPPFIQKLFHEAHLHGNAVPVLRVRESIRHITDQTNRTMNRTNLYTVQTPQVFKTSDLFRAFEQPGFTQFTDEASLVENAGIPIHSTEGDPVNIKITYPSDLDMVRCLLQSPEEDNLSS